jgi:hypothetical protein
VDIAAGPVLFLQSCTPRCFALRLGVLVLKRASSALSTAIRDSQLPSPITDVKICDTHYKTLAGAWAGGTEYGVNFVLLTKIVRLVLCVTSFPFVIFLRT